MREGGGASNMSVKSAAQSGLVSQIEEWTAPCLETLATALSLFAAAHSISMTRDVIVLYSPYQSCLDSAADPNLHPNTNNCSLCNFSSPEDTFSTLLYF